MVSLSEIAKNKLVALMAEDGKATYLRMFVKGGGCSGYSYGMSFVESVDEEDNVVEVDGIKIVLDPQSAPLLQGALIDYTDGLQGSGFAIKNPNAKTTCGCGSSFSA